MVAVATSPMMRLTPLRLNLSNNWSCALSWGALREETPHDAQADAPPIPCGFSAPLAAPPAGGGRRGTTVDGGAQSVVAGPAPTGTARSAAAATAHPHAPATPDVACHRGDHCEFGV